MGRVKSKFALWKGKCLNMMRRAQLVNSIIF